MQKKKRTPLDAQQSHLWIIGGGIAGRGRLRKRKI